MSYHVHDPQVASELSKQRRMATLASVIVSLLAVVFICIVLAFILVLSTKKESVEIITFRGSNLMDEVVEKPEVTNQVERKPSAPSSSMASVIVSTASSSLSLPVVEMDFAEPSVEFGNGDDFGAGWGGNGNGGGGGGVSFFQQQSSARNVVFVIDYSHSMSGQRISLLKKELSKTIKNLPEGMKYQLIFFAGPAWLAGDQVAMTKDRKKAVVTAVGRDYTWRSDGTFHNWRPSSARMKPDWINVSPENVAATLQHINNTPLVSGTAWEDPLTMALDMRPQPDVIYFMGDGASGGESANIASRVAAKAKRSGVKVNVIALMDLSATGPMTTLAKETGGAFNVVEKNGRSKVVVKAAR